MGLDIFLKIRIFSHSSTKRGMTNDRGQISVFTNNGPHAN